MQKTALRPAQVFMLVSVNSSLPETYKRLEIGAEKILIEAGHSLTECQAVFVVAVSLLPSISLVAPFALYVPADALGASGVIAAMTGGMYLNRKSSVIFDAESRLAAGSVWNLLFFTFNGAAFVLIGLELRTILRALPMYSVWTRLIASS